VTQLQHVIPAGLLHDLRTPLNHIIGFSELMTDQAQQNGQGSFVKDLQKVRSAGTKLLELINDNFHAVRDLDTLKPSAHLEIETSLDKTQEKHAQGTMLVVDDNEANRDVLTRRLEGQGYTVATAENGREALEQLRAETFDLVLLDIMMPEVDGYEVLRQLKEDAELIHIPVIMISALSEMASVARCIEMGAEDYLLKPFNPTLLKARISSCLEKKRAHDRETQLYQQLQRNYKRLEELETLRDDLTHMIVHDLRTPLTSVISGMQSLQAVGELSSDQQQMMDIAVMGGESLLGMINDLLDVDKLESGSMELDYVLLSVDELVSSAVRQVDSLAATNGLKLIRKIPEGLQPLMGDEDKLRRTLVNLLGNAIKFTPTGGSVTIEACSVGESIQISVVDTGEGIPAEAHERIFEKFGQVESRQGGRKLSTGLGLTFCKLTVESHGGNISVTSSAKQGSIFSFTIPLKSPSEFATNAKML
jgi:two-component system, sensor histidine kinase and response regulator